MISHSIVFSLLWVFFGCRVVENPLKGPGGWWLYRLLPVEYIGVPQAVHDLLALCSHFGADKLFANVLMHSAQPRLRHVVCSRRRDLQLGESLLRLQMVERRLHTSLAELRHKDISNGIVTLALPLEQDCNVVPSLYAHRGLEPLLAVRKSVLQLLDLAVARHGTISRSEVG